MLSRANKALTQDHDSATKEEEFLKARDALYEVECTVVEMFHVKALGGAA
jgi:hypothetical protein